MVQVLFTASEAAPFIQTGGLAEVAGSLPLALARIGCDVRLVIPGYRAVLAQNGWETMPALPVPGHARTVGLRRRVLAPRCELWVVEAGPEFDRPGGPYLDATGHDWADNAERFAFFSHAVAALAQDGMPDGWRAQVVHANDWQTALVPLLLHPLTPRPGTLFTIHNLAYRGLCDFATFERLRLPHLAWHHEGLEFHGQCALIKAGLVYADRISTVSPTYAREITAPAHGWGLEGVLQARARVLSGILNGIDHAVWDPATDPLLRQPYDADRLALRARNKLALQETFGLAERNELMLVGSVTRLAEQKGIDLVLEAIPGLLQHPVQFAFLGDGDPRLEAWLRRLAEVYPGRVGFRRGYDVALSHLMYGGLDVFAMPSRFEPCGLSQLYSQRYGVVPVVRRTGGLADSVVDAVSDAGTGFVFDELSSLSAGHAIWRALQAFQAPAQWTTLQQRGMACDFSWTHSAREYLALYRTISRG